MPFDAFAQPERQLGLVLVPGPLAGEVRHDRLHAALRNVLLVQDKIVEDPHRRPLAGGRRFLMDRHARRAVEKVDL